MANIWTRTMLVVIAFTAGGCGDRPLEKPTYPVTGKVSLDGSPIAEGIITFEADPPDGLPPGSEAIKGGTYSLKASAGKKIVRIRAPRIVPGQKGPMDTDVTEETVPPQYNSESKESVEVKAGPNTFDFDLKK